MGVATEAMDVAGHSALLQLMIDYGWPCCPLIEVNLPIHRLPQLIAAAAESDPNSDRIENTW